MAPVRFYSSIDEEIVIERLDKAPRLSISILIWILSSGTICQLNQFHTNSEAATQSGCCLGGAKQRSKGLAKLHRGQRLVEG